MLRRCRLQPETAQGVACGLAPNCSMPITGRSARSRSRPANALRRTSSARALAIAAMIMPWSSERYELDTTPLSTLTLSRNPHFVYRPGKSWASLSMSASAARAAGEAVVHERVVLVGRIAIRVHADRVDAIGGIAALGDVGGREAPVAILRLVQPVVDLCPHRERVVDPPASRRPALLRHEQRRHQRLEHAAAP